MLTEAEQSKPGPKATAEPVSLFEVYEPADVLDLIREYPLAWVTARGGDAQHASLLPLLAETDANGRLVRLVGHMARRNPLVGALTADPHALILFNGPQAYVSPSLVGERAWVPTWNYAQVRIEGELIFEPEGGDAALAMLVDAMEAGRAEPWHVEETGARYRSMEQAIIAFRVHVGTVRGRFKLGQDERHEVLRAIIANHPDAALVRWMERFGRRRGIG